MLKTSVPIQHAELWRLSATELAAGYARGAFTPHDALIACLARIHQCQPVLNMMVTAEQPDAHSAAHASGARWAAGQPLSAIDGVPLTIKDNLHVQGMPTTWGSKLFEHCTAAEDELPVARLRGAGAIILGKTNVPEFAMQGYTANLIAGVTRNPWNPELTPGGSSGGAVAAVASGCGPLALATDGGGSIRRPASHCGLVGFKPSGGLVPRSGGLPEIFLGYEVAGGIGRSVADVRHMLEILAARQLDAEIAPSRILFLARFGGKAVDDGIAASVANAADHLGKLGHRITRQDDVDLANGINARWSSLSAAGLAWLAEQDLTATEFSSHCGAAARQVLQQGLQQPASALFELLLEIHTLKRRMEDLFRDYDFILTPATAALPWPADEAYPKVIAGQHAGPRDHAAFTALANAAGLPAVALPTGFVDGLPTGLQLIAPSGADAALLALAAQYEHAHPWARHWPDISFS